MKVLVTSSYYWEDEEFEWKYGEYFKKYNLKNEKSKTALKSHIIQINNLDDLLQISKDLNEEIIIDNTEKYFNLYGKYDFKIRINDYKI